MYADVASRGDRDPKLFAVRPIFGSPKVDLSGWLTHYGALVAPSSFGSRSATVRGQKERSIVADVRHAAHFEFSWEVASFPNKASLPILSGNAASLYSPGVASIRNFSPRKAAAGWIKCAKERLRREIRRTCRPVLSCCPGSVTIAAPASGIGF